MREAVLALRRGKGMVLDPADHDTWSAGSFFTNPFVSRPRLPDGAPAFPQPDGSVKTSAAWLIEQAGFGKGYGNERVSLSTKHTLALTNRGGATTADLLALAARDPRRRARQFGDRAPPEPTLLNCDLLGPPSGLSLARPVVAARSGALRVLRWLAASRWLSLSKPVISTSSIDEGGELQREVVL